MRRWTPDRVTALILICSCIAMIASGIDSEVKSILTIASGYLFGAGITERRFNHQIREREVTK